MAHLREGQGLTAAGMLQACGEPLLPLDRDRAVERNRRLRGLLHDVRRHARTGALDRLDVRAELLDRIDAELRE